MKRAVTDAGTDAGTDGLEAEASNIAGDFGSEDAGMDAGDGFEVGTDAGTDGFEAEAGNAAGNFGSKDAGNDAGDGFEVGSEASEESTFEVDWGGSCSSQIQQLGQDGPLLSEGSLLPRNKGEVLPTTVQQHSYSPTQLSKCINSRQLEDIGSRQTLTHNSAATEPSRYADQINFLACAKAGPKNVRKLNLKWIADSKYAPNHLKNMNTT